MNKLPESLSAVVAVFCWILNSFFPNYSHATSTGSADPYHFQVEVSGQGSKAIIFIPGFASSGKVWDDTRQKFEKSYKCYTLTMAGFAGAKPEGEATFKTWTESIARYIKDNNIAKPIVIGHSMGGAMALALASEYPDLVGKIVVIDALPCLAAMSNPTFQPTEKPDCSAMITQMTSLSNDQFTQMQRMTVRGLVADTTTHNMIVGWSVASDRSTLGKMFCDFMNTDLREKLKSIKCPSLILLEPYFKTMGGAVESQYRNLATADLQYATKGLHFIMFDDKQWYLDQLSRFIAAK